MTAPRLPSSNILLHMHGVVVRQTSVSAPFNVHLGASCWTPSSSSVSLVESSTGRLTGAPKPLTSTTALHWSEKRKYAATRIKLTTLDVVVASAEPFNPRFIILMKSTLSAMLSKKVAKLVHATGLTTPRTCRNFCMTRVHAAANRPTISKVQNLPTRSDVYSSWLRIVRAMFSPHERTMAAGTQHAVRKAAARNSPLPHRCKVRCALRLRTQCIETRAESGDAEPQQVEYRRAQAAYCKLTPTKVAEEKEVRSP